MNRWAIFGRPLCGLQSICRPLKRALDDSDLTRSRGVAPGYYISRLQRENPSLSSQNRLSVDCDLDGVADYDAAFVHGVVPADAKVLAVD